MQPVEEGLLLVRLVTHMKVQMVVRLVTPMMVGIEVWLGGHSDSSTRI